MGGPDFYQQSHEQVNETLERLQAVEEELEACFGRWETLEAPYLGEFPCCIARSYRCIILA